MANWEASGRKIQKVPSFLRDKSDAYDPKVVSLGPYHHGKPELQLCQNAKHLTFQMFVEGSDHTHEFFKEEVGKVVEYARSCYVEGSTYGYDDEQFVEMMLLDACFLIFCMGINDERNRRHLSPIYIYMGKLVYSMINRDMYLVENQIPFQLVMHLINLRYDKKQGEDAVTKFMYESIWGGYRTHEQAEVSEEILQAEVSEEILQAEVSEEILQYQNMESSLHILEAFHKVLKWDFNQGQEVNSKEGTVMRNFFKSFRSAKDLKAKGIYLKPSEKRSLKSISFNSFTFYGQLELPVWFVSHISKVFFPNMIAYELCLCNHVDTTVTSYLDFMKSLIEKPADVKELREKKILWTELGSDEEVVQFFRKLETFGIDEFFGYMDVKKRIQEHYDSKAKTWRAELIHTYLSSPWSIIGWLAALFLLILTFLQTYFTIAK